MAARRKLLFHVDQVISFCDNCNPTNDAASIDVDEHELEKRWKKLSEYYEELMTADESEQKQDVLDLAKDKFKEAYDKYRRCLVRLTKAKPQKQSQLDESMRRDTTFTAPGFSSLKLPPCDTQPFEGGYSKWPAFRDIFWGVFGTHAEISSAQKLYHLRNKTRGEAHQIVKKFDLVDGNFELAWDALKNRYENPRILVHQQMKVLFGIQAAQVETAKAVRQIQRGINDSLSIFRSYKIKTENWDPILVHHCASKIPEDTLRAWEDSLSDHKKLPTWEQMDEFLSKRIEMLETISDMRKPSHSVFNKSQTFHTKTESTKTSLKCKKCNGDHNLRYCDKFKSMTVKERVKFVYNNKMCVNCLSPNHFKSKCQSKVACFQCNKKHHTLLHLESKEKSSSHVIQASGVQSPIEQPSTSTNVHHATNESNNHTSTPVQTHFSQHEGTTILPTAIVNIHHAGDKFAIRALLDAGSEKSFVTKRIQQLLSLPTDCHHIQISGLGGTVVGNSSQQCCINVESTNSSFRIRIRAIVVHKLSHFLPSRKIRVENLPDLKNIKLADPNFFTPAAIDMIIGSDYLPLINLNGVLSYRENGFEARESHFGWYLSGPLPSNTINTFSTVVKESADTALTAQLKRFWEIEEVEHLKPISAEDDYCEEFYCQTTYRQPDGRYVVRLPFRKEFPEAVFLGPSRNMALAQYHRMEKTLNKTPDLKNQYERVLQEYITLDHMEEVRCFENHGDKQNSFYLPHHAVVKPESKTTKVRVVFNGSKKSGSGFSLNNVLYPGPILQTDIVRIILRWRCYQFVFTGDIEKMYRQIIVRKPDRAYQRILFRPNSNEAIKTFELKTVTFGINCAPFLAIRTLKQLASDCEMSSPKAADILKNEIYVDDVLSGGYSLEEAKEKQAQLMQTLASASFPFKKITANHKFLLQGVAREDLLDEDFLNLDDSSMVKTLGIRWNAKYDHFYYVVGPIDDSAIVTKRQILSVVARLFDPLGWLGPIVIIAKLIMQQLWETNTDWDEAVPPHLLEKWKSFRKNLQNLLSLKIPRWVDFSPVSRVQIHGFCDASERAYCGAVYLRVENSGNFFSNLLVAKTRVSPIKKTTIPKLELCGAVLLTNLVKVVIESLTCEFELHLWTDSSIVLGWLQKSPQTLKTFVANRVSHIQTFTKVTNWKHVKTEDNPADLGTRGSLPQDLIQNSLWWTGPLWIRTPENEWPEPRSFAPTDLETKKSSNFHITASECLITRFSSYSRALRVISYVLRVLQKPCSRPKNFDIFTVELEKTKNCLLIIAQKSYYPEEYECLFKNQHVNSKSNISALAPFIDKNGVMRVRGRLENSGLSYDERHPVIVPEKSHFASLLINYTHQLLCHAEYNVMLRAIRQGFYITRLKNGIRKCIRACKPCTIFKRKFQHQMMASLPPERATFSLPFTYTGVDFAGPFNIKTSTMRNAKIVKGYAAVFVCFSTKAVHLEVCSDLSTDAFLAAFTRFTGRRGLPKTMFSDNGKNFVGASYKLLQAHHSFLKSAEKCLINKFGIRGFTWSFIPPYAPHMGGLWESAVRIMKSHLKKQTGNVNFTYEEFSTLLIRIEAIMNSRPLSALSDNISELLPLTPGHFLRGAPITASPDAPEQPPTENLSYLSRWRRLQAIQHIFSQRWKSEYITELQRRYKWKSTRNNLKENEFVIVKDDHLPATEWRLGRITKVFYGKDNNVRVAEIKTQNGIITRPIVKLCVLPSQHTNVNPQSDVKTDKSPLVSDHNLEI
ncbi:uncharacterized protein LOC142224849 [Haematobia irritans]|uniref:uncharacterized protein LOC142224849 n=1 Tax=Haematobia irritans TaxID=7368 RepID=UPI003F505683